MSDVALRVGGAVVGAAITYFSGGTAGPLGISVAQGAAIGLAAGGLAASARGKKLPAIDLTTGLMDRRIMLAGYGTPLGVIFGTARKQINVVWGQPIERHIEATTQKTGKGGGSEQEVTSEWFSATFFGVGAEGPATGVLRAWFNGELVYHMGTDSRPDWFLASRDMHIMLGAADQQPSSIMESFEGAGNVPAYRGAVGVLLDTLALGPSGQHLPNIELEIARSGELITLVPQSWITLPDSEEFYDSGLFDPARVALAIPDSSRVWVVLDVGGNPRRLASFNSYSQTYDVKLDFDGDIYLTGVDLAGGAWVAQEGGAGEGLYRIDTLGGPSFYSGTEDFDRWVETAVVDDTVLVMHYNAAVGGHPIYTVELETGVLSKTAVTTGKFLNQLFTRAAAVQGRVYVTGYDTNAVTPAPPRIGYVSESGAWTTLVDYNQIGPQSYGIVGDTYLYVRSGNTGESNRIEKRTHDGTLVDYVTLTDAGATAYTDVYQFSLSSDETYLFVKNGSAIWKIHTGTMDESLANESAGSVNEQFVQGSAYQGKGVMVTQIGTDPTVIKIVPPNQLLDPSPPSLADCIEELITRSILTSADLDLTALDDIQLLGYVISQPTSIADAINILRPLYFFDLIESDYKIKAILRTGSSLTTVPEAHLGARTSRDEIVDPVRITRVQEIDLPRRMTLSYISYGKDYQTGTQSTGRLSTTSQQEATLGVPVVLTDAQAAQILEKGLYEAWSLREPMDMQTSRRYSLYEPGDVWTLYNGNQVRLVDKLEGANGLIKWRGVPHFPEAYEQDDTEGVSNGGGQAIVPLAPTEAWPLDIHLLRQIDDYTGFYVPARGLSTRWDGAKLYVSPDDGVSYEAIPNGVIAAAAGIGSLTAAVDGPPNGRYESFDWANVLELRMRPGVELSSYTEAQIFAGTATPLLIKRTDEPGGEILYYRNAVNTAPQIWEVSGLLRARGGTEEYVEHGVGELVVVLDSALLSVMQSATDVNRELIYKAPSIGSTLANATPIPFVNTNIRAKPLAPVHLGGGVDGDGGIVVHWTRRTRYPTSITEDSVIEPLGEAFEKYLVEVFDGDDVIDSFEVTEPEAYLSPDDMDEWFGGTRPHVYVRVRMISDTYGPGYAAEGWVPAVNDDEYLLYRIHAITTNTGNRMMVGEFQLIHENGSTIVSAGVTPVSTTAPVFSSPASRMTDGDLDTETDYQSIPSMPAFYFEFTLPYPAKLAGVKQGGTPTYITGSVPPGGANNVYPHTFSISGSNDEGATVTLVASFSGLTYPGSSTLSSLYPIP